MKISNRVTLRRSVSLAGMALLPLLLVGCFKFTMDLEISGQDTVSGTAMVGLSKELQAFAETEEDSDTTEAFADIEGATRADFDDGAFVGQEYAFSAVPIEAFALRDEARVLTITRDGDNLVVDGSLNFEDPNAGSELDFGLGQAFFDAAEIRVTIKFPGEVLETNGEVDTASNTVTWFPQYGVDNKISAVVFAPPGMATWIWWVIGGGVAVLVAVAAFVFARPKPTLSDLDGGEPVSEDEPR